MRPEPVEQIDDILEAVVPGADDLVPDAVFLKCQRFFAVGPPHRSDRHTIALRLRVTFLDPHAVLIQIDGDATLWQSHFLWPSEHSEIAVIFCTVAACRKGKPHTV